MPILERQLSPKGVAAELGVSRRTVLDYIAAGKLPAIRYSPRVIRVTESDLRDFMNAARAGDAR